MRAAAVLLLLACGPPAAAPVDAAGAGDAGTPDAAPWDGPTPDAAPDAAPGQAEALSELRAATLGLESWRFATDPGDTGLAAGWAGEGLDDSGWATIAAGRTWEEQGYAGYDGLGWYRARVLVPAAWAGSTVRFLASGVDDEYDLYVNGAFVKHYGAAPDRSVWGWQTRAEIQDHLRFGAENLIVLRVNDWGGGGGAWRAVTLRRAVPLEPYAHLLPAPILDGRPDLVALYWVAWQMAFDKVSFGTAANGFAAAYMDEGFNEQIYQWDSAFICLFARYGRRLFPVMATLDNFYSKQRADGYIQRVYSETDGGEMGEPTAAEPMINPPLFAWVELEHARSSGDTSRIAAVLPVLEAYHGWIDANLRDAGGLYRQTPLGSGMDNTPRGNPEATAWIDMSAEQALAALSLARLHNLAGDDAAAAEWHAAHASIAAAINSRLWATTEGFYMDEKPSGELTGVEHIGAFWTLLAEVAPAERVPSLVTHLEDPTAFHRAYLFPTLSAADPAYDPAGHYWHGGIWAPTNYATIRGLHVVGEDALAREAAASHLDQMAAVYADPPAAAAIAPEEQDGDYATLWEAYAPESAAPATRWDGTYLTRQDFVGWSGLGPIALLLEELVGVEVLGLEGRVVWTVVRSDRHGVRRLPLGALSVDLIAAARADAAAPLHLDVASDGAFTLEVRRPGLATQTFSVPPGGGSYDL